jgi:hypothetical protein
LSSFARKRKSETIARVRPTATTTASATHPADAPFSEASDVSRPAQTAAATAAAAPAHTSAHGSLVKPTRIPEASPARRHASTTRRRPEVSFRQSEAVDFAGAARSSLRRERTTTTPTRPSEATSQIGTSRLTFASVSMPP